MNIPTDGSPNLPIDQQPTLAMNISIDVSPNHPIDQQPTIGLIGMGAMGTMYAKHLSNAGWKKYVLLFLFLPVNDIVAHRISVCDLPEKYESLKLTYKGSSDHTRRK